MYLLTPLANGIKVAQGPFRTRCSDITATGAVTLHYMMQGQGSRGFCRFGLCSFVWREPMFAFEFDQALFEFA